MISTNAKLGIFSYVLLVLDTILYSNVSYSLYNTNQSS